MKTTTFRGRDFLAETDFTREEIETDPRTWPRS